ncbi:MAG: peptide-methionine (S)-S-oxide reductase MsrA [Candidatus Bathyarchaeota archaeon]
MTENEISKNLEIATLGGGCFWCLEAVFSQLRGIKEIDSGYSGGSIINPTYEQVSTGRTGHAEVVQLLYDPDIISYREILKIFFTIHDPTTLNRQGADEGTQYRSVIFYHTEEQKKIAEQIINEFNSEEFFDSSIVTEVEPFKAFYSAEDYHRNYFQRHPEQPYCRIIISPKVAKLRKKFSDKLKS